MSKRLSDTQVICKDKCIVDPITAGMVQELALRLDNFLDLYDALLDRIMEASTEEECTVEGESPKKRLSQR